MKLLRIGEPGAERPAVLDADGIARDLSGVVADFGPACTGWSTIMRRPSTARIPGVPGPRCGAR
jgi:2,4-didehydro-3-deoxy-L-rhamnonate hydrolase